LGGTCNKNCRDEKFTKILVGNLERKKHLVRPKSRGKDGAQRELNLTDLR